MINNLDEAIKHCEKVAEAEEQKYKEWKGDYSHLKKIDSCLECANEHRQLAEWLRELKEIKHLFSVTEKLFKACLRDDSKDIVDGHEILYSEHKQLREIFAEVNADDSN